MKRYYAIKYENGGSNIVLNSKDAKLEVKRNKGAKYKGFMTYADAVNWTTNTIPDGVYVDGAYDHNTNICYWCVATFKDNIATQISGGIVPIKEFIARKSTGAEMYASYIGAQIAIDNNMTLYTDYKGIESLISGHYKAKTKGTKLFKSMMGKLLENNILKIQHIHSHSGNIGNEFVDKIIKQMIHKGE